MFDNILVTGASGYVGAKIYSDLRSRFFHQGVIGTFHSNKVDFGEPLIPLDVTDKNQLEEAFKFWHPSVVVHVAANSSASWCKKNLDKAWELNVYSARNLAQIAGKSTKIIFISSYAAIDPANEYGESKWEAENFIKENAPKYVILRPSLIIGQSPNTKNDRPHNRMLKNITEGTPAVYDHSWRFQPTWLNHLSEIVSEILYRDRYYGMEGARVKPPIKNETIHVACPELTTRFDLARDILLEGFDRLVNPTDKGVDEAPIEMAVNEELERLKLPTCAYPEMIEGTVADMKAHLS